ncbi:hypothetical protein LTR35_012098 [Friedmanniomyces endolithicus]|uniref:Cyanovirin-N domain-containing protein n=1 Tax=Friedmanniomyces endolithicus TaxID=329885 RepID=A0AAN6FSQ0_9PEZI|nr:hypothetical protein LTR35_012098 [Friedmanniomyces endolithicus]KAK0284350.1 hypothetical protein LTS00_011307 [Friedmanniomyces endolithicus]KAK0323139.1 hypothetical protein LTR82_006070 [Friedmanniomyces endolithicus]KAK0995972.1 hypothetical protein LTR54_010266 [Friedmanniomyces endolithicus]
MATMECNISSLVLKMTRNPPQGGYQGGENNTNSQQSQYGAYDSREGQAYADSDHQQPRPYGGQSHGAAQGDYGSNDQTYQQDSFLEDFFVDPRDGQNAATPHFPGAVLGEPPHTQPSPYNSGQYPTPECPPYGQPHYAPQGHYAPQDEDLTAFISQFDQLYGQVGSSSSQYPRPGFSPYDQPQYTPQSSYAPQGGNVDAFKSHFDQPYGPVDPTSSQSLPPSAEGDRGVLGALAGGAVGAYGGHQVHHSFLGGIGGAVAGSMLEDAYKKHNKPDKKDNRRGSHCSHGSSSSDSDDGRKRRGATMAGNFSASSRGVHLEGATLVAECCNSQGHHHDSRLDLNDCFTNSDGRLRWARGGNFAASSRGMQLVNGGRELEAELGDGRGGWTANRVFLDERITNDDGRLHLLS